MVRYRAQPRRLLSGRREDRFTASRTARAAPESHSSTNARSGPRSAVSRSRIGSTLSLQARRASAAMRRLQLLGRVGGTPHTATEHRLGLRRPSGERRGTPLLGGLMIAAGGWGDQGVHFSLGVPSLQASGTRGAFRKSLVPCSSCARMTAPHARGHVASLHECALLHAAQRDDRRAQEELLRRYEPLIRATVHRLRLPCRCDCSDIAQEARIGLLSAIRAWQPTRGPFRAFAARCAIAQVIKALDTAAPGSIRCSAARSRWR